MISTIILYLQLSFLPLHNAQDIFNYDQKGLVTYSSVVEQNGFTRDLLKQNAMEFFESADKKTRRKRKFIKLNACDTLLEYSRSTILYAKSLGKYPEGKLTYSVKLEIKENRYRYIIQNFIFTPYAKNRYAKYEAVRGKSQTLESMLVNEIRNKKETARYKSINMKIEALVTAMNLALMEMSVESQKKVVEVNDSW